MRVFGLDPGVTKVGWAIVDEEIVDLGVFNPSSSAETFNDKINEEMLASIQFFREKLKNIDAVAWEIVPAFGAMSQRDRVVGVAAALKFVTWEYGLPWIGLHPVTIKKLATTNHRATKKEMKEEVYRRFPKLQVEKKLPVDAFDAVLIAVVAREKKEWSHERL